jgi:SAM-dependent methyltransferase
MSHHEDDFWQIVAAGLRLSDLIWLEPLRPVVDRIIVFGCWDDGGASRQCRESYALLRILEATHAVVVDREAEYIRNARSWYQETRTLHPQLLGAWDLQFVVSDMTGPAQELPSDAFDLAYCSGVLYFGQSDARQLQAAVSTMARVVRPGGWVIASEDPGLAPLFEGAGLVKADRPDGAPDYAYCYRKAGATERG